MVMLVNNHDDAFWITMMKMLVNYICICAYMLLVNFLACYWWWLDCVSMYWNMLMTLIELWLVDGVDVNTWWCNWWWINQCKWRCTFTLMLVNTYVRWVCIVESLLVSMHHSHVESYVKCQRRCTFTLVNCKRRCTLTCKRRCTLTYDVFVASWGDDLGGDLVPHVSRVGIGTLHV